MKYLAWFMVLVALAVLAYVLFSKPAQASTDYTCMSRCMNSGYSYGYCKNICSY